MAFPFDLVRQHSAQPPMLSTRWIARRSAVQWTEVALYKITNIDRREPVYGTISNALWLYRNKRVRECFFLSLRPPMQKVIMALPKFDRRRHRNRRPC